MFRVLGLAPSTTSRHQLLRRGIRLETFTIAYNLLEGIIAIGAGWLAGSIALVGFGLDSTIETTSAIVVLLRLCAQARGQDPETLETGERRTQRFVGVTLLALCAYILYESITTLIRQETPSESTVGIVLASLSLVVMPYLGLSKRQTGRALRSGALIADSTETFVCLYLSFTLLVGLGLNAAFGWWWADPVAGLIMVPFIFREGREAWQGEVCA
jgi:divalent metal cation (Fe/Co/Zn/Cd) transporter